MVFSNIVLGAERKVFLRPAQPHGTTWYYMIPHGKVVSTLYIVGYSTVYTVKYIVQNSDDYITGCSLRDEGSGALLRE